MSAGAGGQAAPVDAGAKAAGTDLPPPARSPERAGLWVGALLAAVLFGLALLAPWLAPHDPRRQWDPAAGRHLRPGTVRLAVERSDGRTLLAEAVRPGAATLVLRRLGRSQALAVDSVAAVRAVSFPLGTDRYGRDLLSRLLWGTRVSLRIGGLSVLLALVLGVGVGALAGLGPRWLDAVLSSLLDALLAFPRLLLVLALAALAGAGEALVVVALALTGWMEVARLVRGELRRLATTDLALAARALGVPPLRLAGCHLLPLALAPVLVTGALRLGDALLAEAALSWLGYGVEAPVASWGSLLAETQASLPEAWWVALFPGLAVATAVLAAALVSEGLRAELEVGPGAA